MKKIFSAISAAAAVFAIQSCCSQPDLNGRWAVISVAGEEVVLPDSLSEAAPFIEFNAAESRVHGNTGCNIMNGSYTLDGKKLKFGQMATTMMAGPQELMELESKVLNAVNSAASFKSAPDGTLQILDAEGNAVMDLRKEASEETAAE